MALKFVLIFTGWFFKDNPLTSEITPLLKCMEQCHYSGTCMGLFYQESTGQCYKTTYLYSHPDYQIEFLEDKVEHVDFSYYEWKLDQCKDGWYYYKEIDTCFKHIAETATPAEGEVVCNNMGGSLISLKSLRKSSLMCHYADIVGKKMFTSGEKIDGVWKWGDGTEIGSQTDWKNDEGSESCIILHEDGSGWESKSCTHSEMYLCEKDAQLC